MICKCPDCGKRFDPSDHEIDNEIKCIADLAKYFQVGASIKGIGPQVDKIYMEEIRSYLRTEKTNNIKKIYADDKCVLIELYGYKIHSFSFPFDSKELDSFLVDY